MDCLGYILTHLIIADLYLETPFWGYDPVWLIFFIWVKKHQLAYEQILASLNWWVVITPRHSKTKLKRPPVPLFAKLPLAQFVGLKENLFELWNFPTILENIARDITFKFSFNNVSYTPKGNPSRILNGCYIYLEIYNTLSVCGMGKPGLQAVLFIAKPSIGMSHPYCQLCQISSNGVCPSSISKSWSGQQFWTRGFYGTCR